MLRNMVTDLFRNDSLKTTDTRAKEIRRVAEREAENRIKRKWLNFRVMASISYLPKTSKETAKARPCIIE